MSDTDFFQYLPNCIVDHVLLLIFPRCGASDRIGDGMCLFRAEYTDLCSIITNSSGPFQQCHLHIDPQAYFTSCVYDLCAYTPANGMLCSAVQAYETACTVLGPRTTEWRSALHCCEYSVCVCVCVSECVCVYIIFIAYISVGSLKAKDL